MARRNVPYVKRFDENGNVTNPIVNYYVSPNRNRRDRRAGLQKNRFRGNKKHRDGKCNSMTVIGIDRYIRFMQVIPDGNGGVKNIYHYYPPVKRSGRRKNADGHLNKDK